MFTFDIVFPGTLLSGQDRLPSLSASPIITNPHLQGRLATIASMIGIHTGAKRKIRGLDYVALFDEKWMLKVDARFYVDPTPGHRLDLDHLWRPLQNALAFPDPNLNVRGASRGSCYWTLVANDRQFTNINLETITHGGKPVADLTHLRLTAYPPPHLDLAFARAPQAKAAV